MAEFIHKELSESIIGAAMTVLNVLKPGLDEKLYERAMVSITGLRLSLLLNFKYAKLDWKRVIR